MGIRGVHGAPPLMSCAKRDVQRFHWLTDRGGWKRSREFRVKLKGIPINWRMHAGSALEDADVSSLWRRL